MLEYQIDTTYFLQIKYSFFLIYSLKIYNKKGKENKEVNLIYLNFETCTNLLFASEQVEYQCNWISNVISLSTIIIENYLNQLYLF